MRFLSRVVGHFQIRENPDPETRFLSDTARMTSTQELDRWVEAGLITEGQARSIETFEATGTAEPAEEVGGLRSVLAEIAGYLGAALIVATLAALLRDLWRDLLPWVQVGIVAIGTAIIGFVGLSLREAQEPALKRLAALLLALAPGGVAWTLWLSGVEIFGEGSNGFVPVVLLVSAAIATWTYQGLRHFFTHASMFVLWAMFVTAVPNSYASLDARTWWITLMALGLSWLLLTEAGVVVPDRLGHVLGTGAALIAAVGSSEYGWEPYVPGLVVASLIVAAGVVRTKPLMVGLGAAGFFIFLATLLFEQLNESAALLVLLVMGVARVAGVWGWARRNRHQTLGA